jgi:hypothetical protein
MAFDDSSGVGIFGSSRSFIGSSSFFFVSETDVIFLTRRRLTVCNQQRQADLGGAAAAAHRRHGLEVEDEGFLKDLIVIFVFLKCFVLFVVSFNAKVLLKNIYKTINNYLLLM